MLVVISKHLFCEVSGGAGSNNNMFTNPPNQGGGSLDTHGNYNYNATVNIPINNNVDVVASGRGNQNGTFETSVGVSGHINF